ncbi:MAG: hypothetical protein PVH30_02785 [Desulfobacterales bacterium]|jgi:hypothetical protein
MIIFDGTYSWKGSTSQKRRVINWWPSSYRLMVVKLRGGASSVRFLRSHIVLFTDTGHGASVANCVQALAKEICRDFSLILERVLWIESDGKPDPGLNVAVFSPLTRVGKETFYEVSWRPILDAEMALLIPYINPEGSNRE